MNANDWTMAQYSVLGSVLIEPQLVPKMMSLTRAEDFSSACRTVYDAMRELFAAGIPVDAVSLSDRLKGNYRKFLMELIEVTPTAANMEHYIRLCRKQAQLQQLKSLGSELLALEDVAQGRALLEQANALLVDKPGVRVVNMSDALHSFFDRHTGEVQYLSWPVPELNNVLYAEKGDFILVGGYPSTGKSAWSLQCAWHWAGNHKVGFFSLETSPEKLFDRQMAGVASLSMDDIKRNRIGTKDWDRICMDTNRITGRNLEIVPAAGMTAADIRSITMMRRYEIILIDYIQLLSGSGSNRTEQVTNISLSLHRMAQDMGVTVVALSQLKRKSGDDEPESSDLRESGQLEQDADVIQILQLEKKNEPDGNRVLHITKNKEGTCPKILLAFDGKHQLFSKANRSSDTLQQLVHDGKKVRRENRANAKAAQAGQWTEEDLGQQKLPF